MQPDIARMFAIMQGSADCGEIDPSDINACCIDGNNALHFAVREGDVPAAKALIGAGIQINKAGDLGYTPLHVASMWGNIEMVKLLLASGADAFALSEGYPPFTTARLAKQDHICDLLAPVMSQTQAQDPNVWIRARIAQLQREIADLEAKLS